jgi:hypothetical protein
MFRKQVKSSPALFFSAETERAIPARHDSARTALVQASLDPAIRSIGHVASANVASEPVEPEAVVIHDDGLFSLDLAPARKVRNLSTIARSRA